MKYWGLVISHLILNVLGHNIDNIHAYYICVDLSWLLIPLFFWLNKYRNVVVIIWVCFAMNNFVDSILLNIDYYNISEFIFAIFVLVLTISKYVNRRNREKHLGCSD